MQASLQEQKVSLAALEEQKRLVDERILELKQQEEAAARLAAEKERERLAEETRIREEEEQKATLHHIIHVSLPPCLRRRKAGNCIALR